MGKKSSLFVLRLKFSAKKSYLTWDPKIIYNISGGSNNDNVWQSTLLGSSHMMLKTTGESEYKLTI